MNLYSIAYKTDDDFMFRETFIKSNSEQEALKSLSIELGGGHFVYDRVVLEEENIEEGEM